jgi:hypothetical protein
MKKHRYYTKEGDFAELSDTVLRIPNYKKLSQGEKQASRSSNNGISFLLILIIVLIALSLVFGGLEFFWNVMDLA